MALENSSQRVAIALVFIVRSCVRVEVALRTVIATNNLIQFIVQELCESRGGRPGLAVLTNLMVSVDVKLY